ncbi:hypothetical protein KY290_006942 [Solanum tuberosum]|uniref:TIR domain-containing protein n=1 Tax=Solanum tuberosum TaxID=4113 RepID=A0ABQ7W5G1_SOLTU|nr:hypothetical protein KY290_006942 [Solanum tuberosum]
MASSSSSFASDSQNYPLWKYDVFLSFRGKDTRKTFTSHLYEGLRNREIFTFQDDKRLEQGDSISQELLKAIKESQVALIVFSRNYATSRWCLNELVKIIECKEEENGQTVIPIFYDVDPSHVRNQSESFAVALKEVPNECFKKLSLEVVNQAKGLPFAFKPEEQKVFLDIACFFRGHERKQVMKIVDSCDFGAEYGLDVLIEKSLVFISKYDRIEMHNLIEDMGKYIVKMQTDSRKPSKVWNVEDFEDVMMDNMQHLLSLRELDLSYSKSLMRTPDFTGMPNLECLYLSKCKNLEEVHHSVGSCRKLIQLHLTYCKRLKRFPCVNVESIEYLHLDDYHSLEKFPEILKRMKPELEIKMNCSELREIPSSIIQQYACRLTELNLSSMENLVTLPSNICKLKGLVKLIVCFSKLESLPEEIGDLENLKELHARDTLISWLPSSIVRLNKANGRTPNDYGRIRLYSPGERKELG